MRTNTQISFILYLFNLYVCTPIDGIKLTAREIDHIQETMLSIDNSREEDISVGLLANSWTCSGPASLSAFSHVPTAGDQTASSVQKAELTLTRNGVNYPACPCICRRVVGAGKKKKSKKYLPSLFLVCHTCSKEGVSMLFPTSVFNSKFSLISLNFWLSLGTRASLLICQLVAAVN